MRFISAAGQDPVLAAAIGHFVQASTTLEHAVRHCIIRVLPLTDDMGIALLSENSMRSNLDILERLLDLPEVPVPKDWKERLLPLIPKVRASTEDRNRIAHHPLIQNTQGYTATIHKKGKRIAMDIDAQTISEWAIEAEESAYWFHHIPQSDYDLKKWGKAFPEYKNNPWPRRQNK